MSHNLKKEIAESAFLALLDQDLKDPVSSIRPITITTFAEDELLTADIEVELDEALPEPEHDDSGSDEESIGSNL